MIKNPGVKGLDPKSSESRHMTEIKQVQPQDLPSLDLVSESHWKANWLDLLSTAMVRPCARETHGFAMKTKNGTDDTKLLNNIFQTSCSRHDILHHGTPFLLNWLIAKYLQVPSITVCFR